MAGGDEKKMAREPRGSRRKRETRTRLVDAAFRLMAIRGMRGVTISEITEEADVGIGSFYNHFDSKESIHAAIVEDFFERFANILERLARDVDDPAEVIAVSVRHAILRAQREPLWGRFLLREGFTPRALDRGLGARLMRDIHIGIETGRLRSPDPVMSFVAAGSCVLGAISLQIDMADHGEVADSKNIPERAAATVLHGLGLSFDKAAAISKRPLPEWDIGAT